MAMSSYLINSNYVDPKFPPCEEYSQSDYLPSHSPDYYSSSPQQQQQRRPDPSAVPAAAASAPPASFQPDSFYHPHFHHHQTHHQNHHHHEPPPPPPPRSEPPFTPCLERSTSSSGGGGGGSAPPASVLMSPRGHVHAAADTAPLLHHSRCESVTPSPSPPRHQSSSPGGARSKDPVVYPWMKKVHVNIVSSSFSGGEPKRSRTAYTRQQVLELEKEFHYNRYLTRRRRVEIAHTLCLSERQIKIWFQNRRMKWKKDHKLPNTKVRSSSSSSGPSTNSQPRGGAL